MSIQQNFPAISPSLSLNFARSKTLDPRITFTRTSSATRVNGQGLIEVVPANTPRFDHSYDPVSGTVKSFGLLIEESRSSVWDYSENTSLGFAGFTNCTISTASTISPTGTQTGDLIITTSSGSQTDIRVNKTGINGQTTNTFSIFLKYSGTNQFQTLVLRDKDIAVNGISVEFNILNGTISIPASNSGTTSGATATIVPYPNGWYRCSVSGLVGGTGGVSCISSTRTISGVNASNAGTGCYVWGAQLEIGSFPTSYIPTSGSTATRTADSASMVGENFSSWYNQSEGTFVTQHIPQDTVDLSVNYGIYSLSNNPTNTERLRFFSGAGRSPVFNTVVSGSTVAYLNAGSSLGVNLLGREGDLLKITTSYSQEDAAIVVENSNVAIDNVDIVSPSSLNNMIIGGDGAGLKELCGHISQLTYYPRRLSNAQLQTLTR